MRENEPSEHHTRTDRPPEGGGDRLYVVVRLVGLGFLLTLAVWALPPRYILYPLASEAVTVPVSGVVKAAPHGAPVARATVTSDRDLAVTDEHGVFRLSSGKGAWLTIEATGFQTAQLKVRNEAPLVLLLFPESTP
jgi:hypothetical protein